MNAIIVWEIAVFRYQPPTPERRIKTIHGRPIERKLGSAVNHLERGGLPVNPAVLSAVRRKLKNGDYNSNREELIKDLRNDPGLYFYSAKHLKGLVENQENGIQLEREIKELEPEKLNQLFSISDREISTHRTRNMTKAQALRLQHSVVSSNAAASMAEGAQLDEDLAYSSALFRQLGLNLIAWNYPDIYSRALRTQKQGKADLEQELERLLGVSPIRIASKLAVEWNIDPEIRRNLEDSGESAAADAEEPDQVMSLLELCQLAELFAKTMDTEHFPEAEQSWSLAEPRVKEKCGVEDLKQQIEPKIKPALEAIERASERPLPRSEAMPRFDLSALTQKSKILFQSNSHLPRCPASIQAKFFEVYRRIEETKVSVEALRELVERAIPETGFVRGCLYLLNEEQLKLEPALRVGEIPLTKYQPFKLFQNNLITSSLDTPVPAKQDGPSVTGETCQRVCGGVSGGQKSGVLYLEVDSDYFAETSLSPVLHFHVIRQALIDCLMPLDTGH